MIQATPGGGAVPTMRQSMQEQRRVVFTRESILKILSLIMRNSPAETGSDGVVDA
jgi:hypothetical protein